MRNDVSKVITERAKGGRTWQKKTPRTKRALLDNQGESFEEFTKPGIPTHQKHRNARYNILERFLVNRVGRPWDKVYAEVCKVADARNFSGAEVRNILKSYVATECWLEGRKVISPNCGGRPVEVRGLYVHPKSGLLRRNDLLR
jgi:hypothetical protein